MLPIIKAFSEGKAIQYRWTGALEWQDMADCETINNVSDLFEWRIKPEPREFWVVVFQSETHGEHRAFESREKAMERHALRPHVCEIVQVREVL